VTGYVIAPLHPETKIQHFQVTSAGGGGAAVTMTNIGMQLMCRPSISMPFQTDLMVNFIVDFNIIQLRVEEYDVTSSDCSALIYQDSELSPSCISTCCSKFFTRPFQTYSLSDTISKPSSDATIQVVISFHCHTFMNGVQINQ
jgi:HD-like signal output (HDOD) protein